ncbi:MAG TPA: electron transport complex subunit RsxC [Elusimicrobia bacterium]|jgi:electron transport complex protein RnfC|nr:electron transport complex subunit RsxC [Elusimicrobiota bacterium]
MKRKFHGGIHPAEEKNTKDIPIRQAREPKKVVLPLQQHTGVPCQPLVKVGDEVKVGQKIGDVNALISAPVHSSVSGKVVAIEPYLHPTGSIVSSVIIESDEKNTLSEEIKPRANLENISLEEIKKIIREAGIVGLGGAAFPTHVKLSPPKEKKIDTLILNGAECEPYLTADYRLMVERTEEIISGMKLLMKALSVERGIIGIEDNKPEAIKTVGKAISEGNSLKVVSLRTKYPQGSEKHLIKSILNREVPSGGLPLDVGVVVNNVGTAYAVYEAVVKGLPLIKRVVTVSGNGVKEPQNLEVKIGTLFQDLISQCGGFDGKIEKIIMGGPLMGIAQYTTEVPVVKGTTGILVLRDSGVIQSRPCIRCGRCIDVCPVYLMPTMYALLVEHKKWEDAEKYNILDCIECGCCAYICPSRIPLVHYIKYGKTELLMKRTQKR